MDPALVALSLLPAHAALAVAEGLRSGASAPAVLARVVSTYWPGDPSRYGRLMARGRRALTLASSSGLRAIAWSDPDYPAPLAAIPDPPPLVWVRGAVEALQRPAVAIVGSRAATPYALEVSARLAAGLAGRGVAVVSGLARGVDSAAHRGAVASGGSTIAVLGCGADRVYPPEHAALAHEIEGRGVVMSELAPGTPPLPRFFPRRNRIISGLARAVVVVEAGERSGSLITARAALDQGRDVMAVPGSVLSGRNRGGHGLLRDGARLVETAGDVMRSCTASARARRRRPRAAHRPGAIRC